MSRCSEIGITRKWWDRFAPKVILLYEKAMRVLNAYLFMSVKLKMHYFEQEEEKTAEQRETFNLLLRFVILSLNMITWYLILELCSLFGYMGREWRYYSVAFMFLFLYSLCECGRRLLTNTPPKILSCRFCGRRRFLTYTPQPVCSSRSIPARSSRRSLAKDQATISCTKPSESWLSFHSRGLYFSWSLIFNLWSLPEPYSEVCAEACSRTRTCELTETFVTISSDRWQARKLDSSMRIRLVSRKKSA